MSETIETVMVTKWTAHTAIEVVVVAAQPAGLILNASREEPDGRWHQVGVKELAIRIDQKPTKTESPVRHYETPNDILNDRSITMHSKLAALDSWELDAQALAARRRRRHGR